MLLLFLFERQQLMSIIMFDLFRGLRNLFWFIEKCIGLIVIIWLLLVIYKNINQSKNTTQMDKELRKSNNF